jgi:hypothetical protein
VLISFNPKTFRKKRYDLREKLQRLRQELYEMRRKHREGAPQWKEPSAVKANYAQRCGALHLKPEFFQLSFYRQGGRSAMAFQLNRYQVESLVKSCCFSLSIKPENPQITQMNRIGINDMPFENPNSQRPSALICGSNPRRLINRA